MAAVTTVKITNICLRYQLNVIILSDREIGVKKITIIGKLVNWFLLSDNSFNKNQNSNSKWPSKVYMCSILTKGSTCHNIAKP